MNATFWIIQIMLFLLKITGAWDLPWARVFVPGYLYISLLVVGVVKLIFYCLFGIAGEKEQDRRRGR